MTQKAAALRKKLHAVAEAPAPASAPAGKAKAAPGRKILILRGALGALALLALYFGGHWLLVGRFLVSTDDAFIAADLSGIAARVPGTVAEVPVAENSAVAAGTVLVKIDDADYRLAVESAGNRIESQNAAIARLGEQVKAQDATIAAARANVDAARAAADREANNYTRAEKLQAQKFASNQTLEAALAARDAANAALSAAEQQVTRAQAELGVLKAQTVEAQAGLKELQTALAKAERDLASTEIKAPFDGTVGNRAVEPGQYVQPGTRVMALIPAKTAYVEANFKETQLGRIRPGMKAQIEVDAFSNAIEGEVESIAPASGAQFSLLPPENATGNFTKIVQRIPVRIAVKDPSGLMLRPGLSAVVTIDTRSGPAP